MAVNKLDQVLNRLDELEPGLRSMDTLFALGEVVTKGEGEFRAGDFDVHIWGHSLDGFSVCAIVRSRFDGNPFPKMIQEQKKWILCCKGEIRVVHGTNETGLTEGGRVTVLPLTAHEIYPVSDNCCAILVTVPADPGLK